MLLLLHIGWMLLAPQSAFDTASIKQNAGTSPGARTQPLPGGRLRVENQTLRALIRTAYRVQDFQLSGGPAWLDSERFDIEAKAEGNPPLLDVVGPMLQGLLEDRFKLKVHSETRELPVYALSAAKKGLRIHAAEGGTCTPYDPAHPAPKACGSIETRKNVLNASSILMADLTRHLSYIFGRTVMDETGFQDRFDVHLEFAPLAPGSSADSSEATIGVALQEQLGLKLTSTRGPVEVLVIDHVARPTSN